MKRIVAISNLIIMANTIIDDITYRLFMRL